ncbi:GTPase [Oceanivirga miroungae]|uniref:HSR1-like GTP-binding protein n=1 Tax=Oceanivirga miroungae TaxID=1130046 RepID=A0A6I8MD34_9FUSO|nr:GTPase [Oceanivirga miroungae]VWL85412.1 HSR1-like GTP-binding protein [Oceanivirga miroungae]
MKIRKCVGCGEILQSDDENKLGYIPYEKLLHASDAICKRCFRLKNYNELPDEKDEKKNYLIELKEIINTVDLVMPIFDVIDLESSMTTEILDLIEGKNIIAILNKVDLLPKSMPMTDISSWFKEIINGENVFPLDICMVSSKKSFGIKGIIKKIYNLSNKKDIKVLVLGVSNVGKSSVLNKLLGKEKLTVSKFSGTTKKATKNLVKFKEKNIYFYDTAGLIPDGRLSELLPKNKADKLVFAKEIRNTKFNIKKDQILMFSNLMYMKSNENIELDIFVSPKVKLHLTNMDKYKDLIDRVDLFNILDKEELDTYFDNNEFVEENIVLEKGYDLSISGLGFIKQIRGKFDVNMIYPKSVKIKERISIDRNNRKKIDMEEELLW